MSLRPVSGNSHSLYSLPISAGRLMMALLDRSRVLSSVISQTLSGTFSSRLCERTSRVRRGHTSFDLFGRFPWCDREFEPDAVAADPTVALLSA